MKMKKGASSFFVERIATLWTKLTSQHSFVCLSVCCAEGKNNFAAQIGAPNEDKANLVAIIIRILYGWWKERKNPRICRERENTTINFCFFFLIFFSHHWRQQRRRQTCNLVAFFGLKSSLRNIDWDKWPFLIVQKLYYVLYQRNNIRITYTSQSCT